MTSPAQDGGKRIEIFQRHVCAVEGSGDAAAIFISVHNNEAYKGLESQRKG